MHDFKYSLNIYTHLSFSLCVSLLPPLYFYSVFDFSCCRCRCCPNNHPPNTATPTTHTIHPTIIIVSSDLWVVALSAKRTISFMISRKLFDRISAPQQSCTIMQCLYVVCPCSRLWPTWYVARENHLFAVWSRRSVMSSNLRKTCNVFANRLAYDEVRGVCCCVLRILIIRLHANYKE